MSRSDASDWLSRRTLLGMLKLGVASSAFSACRNDAASERTGPPSAPGAATASMPAANASPTTPPATDVGAAAASRNAASAASSDTTPASSPSGNAGSAAGSGATPASSPSSSAGSAGGDIGAGRAVRPRELIDFHAHFLPQAYVTAATSAGQTPDGLAEWPTWSFDEHFALMEQAGVDISVLSIPSPGIHFGDDAAASALARLVNDEAAELVQRAPDRLRFLASLPLPNVAGAVAEWRRVRAMPGCVGAIVLSHTQGIYAGDKSFDPLWTELNASPMLALVHPTSPPDWKLVSPNDPSATMEVYFESVRACMSMFESSVVTRFPNVKFLIPNCGGALPAMLDRIVTFGIAGYALDPSITMREHMGLYFDCAGTPFPTQLPALLQQTTISRVVYGSESCFTPTASVLAQVADLERELQADGQSIHAALVSTGRSLLPQ